MKRAAFLTAAAVLAVVIWQWMALPSWGFETVGQYEWQYHEFTDSFSRFLSQRHEESQQLVKPFFIIMGIIGFYVIYRQLTRLAENNRPVSGEADGAGSDEMRQRRAWARLSVQVELPYWVREEGDSRRRKKGQTLDISGGGLMMLTREFLTAGDILEMNLDLPGGSSFQLTGKVMRVAPAFDGERRGFIVGIQFVDLKHSEQEKIVKWIFRHQRELLVQKRRIEDGRCVRCGKPLPQEPERESLYCAHCTIYSDL